jgi:hypothetical protein
MSDPNRAREILQELVEDFGPDLAAEHRWFDERDRWIEFAQAVAFGAIGIAGTRARAACDALKETGLLDQAGAMRDPSRAQGAAAILIENGLSTAEADALVGALGQVGDILDRRFGGKIQIFLRRCLEATGDRMLDELVIETIPVDRRRLAYRLWLQNVLSAPLSLELPAAADFCSRLGIEFSELVQAADDADISVALLDDMLLCAIDAQLNGKPAEKDR